MVYHDCPLDGASQSSWYPRDVATACSIMQYNLATCHAIRGEFEKSLLHLKQTTESLSAPLPAQMTSLYIYLELMEGRYKSWGHREPLEAPLSASIVQLLNGGKTGIECLTAARIGGGGSCPVDVQQSRPAKIYGGVLRSADVQQTTAAPIGRGILPSVGVQQTTGAPLE